MPHHIASVRPRVLASISTALTVLTVPTFLNAQGALSRRIDAATVQVLPSVIAWRRDIHQHPELSNREVRTAKLVADHLTRLGLEVRTGVRRATTREQQGGGGNHSERESSRRM